MNTIEEISVRDAVSEIEKVLFDRGFVAHRMNDREWTPINASQASFFSTAQAGCLYTAWIHPDGRTFLYGISGFGKPIGIIGPTIGVESQYKDGSMYTTLDTQGLFRLEQKHGPEYVIDLIEKYQGKNLPEELRP